MHDIDIYRGLGDKQMRIKQADFAALISGALNIPFPTNSVGRFPASLWENQSFAYNSLLANFRQIHEMMDLKKSLVTKGMLPFSPFTDEDEVHRLVRASYRLAQSQEFDNAVRMPCNMYFYWYGSHRNYMLLNVF